jgi:RNA polymerase sigma factor (sigma-70 family)
LNWIFKQIQFLNTENKKLQIFDTLLFSVFLDNHLKKVIKAIFISSSVFNYKKKSYLVDYNKKHPMIFSKIDYFKSWLYMVAKNHCLMELRKKKPHIKELTHNDIGTDELIDRIDFIQKNHELDMMHLAITKLNDEQRICIESFYLKKKSYLDISEETKYSIGEVKSYIQNGKRNLKIIMEKQQKNERK